MDHIMSILNRVGESRSPIRRTGDEIPWQLSYDIHARMKVSNKCHDDELSLFRLLITHCLQSTEDLFPFRVINITVLQLCHHSSTVQKVNSPGKTQYRTDTVHHHHGPPSYSILHHHCLPLSNHTYTSIYMTDRDGLSWK
ncbi:hypothetical protein BDB01DRAFT_836152 [Pilobolus umbonatus]|nr:hypothetical protein BDB01DRAFT_836152 [Pilobolus umbonatus]